MKVIVLAIAAVLVFALPARAAVNDVVQTTVWRAGDGPYKVYRIPSAIATPAGTLLAFCEGRRNGDGDSGEINLLLKRCADGGKTFADQQIVWADGPNTCGNPCAVVDESTKVVWLLMTHNLGEDHEPEITRGTAKGKRTVWVTSSSDDGVTWPKPREITADVSTPQWTWYATGPGVGVQLKRGDHAGRLVIPCDHVSAGNVGNAHVIFSDDHGQTWKLGGAPPRPEFNESQVVELSDGRVMLNMRNFGPAVRAGAPPQRGVCVSVDGGETFTDLRRDPKLIEPLCQGSIIRYRELLLFSNPASKDARVDMTVRQSRDDGATWPTSKLIHKGPAAYSCVVALPDGSVGLLYECGEKTPYERIDFARFSLP